MVELKEGGLWINGVVFTPGVAYSVPTFEMVRDGITSLLNSYEECKKMRDLNWSEYIESKALARRLEKTLAEKECLISGLKDQLRRENEKVSELQRRLDVRDTNDETEKGCISGLNNQISYLQKILAEKEEEISRLRRVNYDRKGKISSMEDSLRSLRVKLDKERMKIKEKEDHICKLQGLLVLGGAVWHEFGPPEEDCPEKARVKPFRSVVGFLQTNAANKGYAWPEKEGDLNAHDKRQLFKDCLDLTRASYSDIETWVDAAKKLYNELLDI